MVEMMINTPVGLLTRCVQSTKFL